MLPFVFRNCVPHLNKMLMQKQAKTNAIVFKHIIKHYTCHSQQAVPGAVLLNVDHDPKRIS